MFLLRIVRYIRNYQISTPVRPGSQDKGKAEICKFWSSLGDYYVKDFCLIWVLESEIRVGFISSWECYKISRLYSHPHTCGTYFSDKYKLIIVPKKTRNGEIVVYITSYNANLCDLVVYVNIH